MATKTNWQELYQHLPTGTATKLQGARIKPDKLKTMTDGEILSINGIGDAALEKIRLAYPITPITEVSSGVTASDAGSPEVAEAKRSVLKGSKKAFSKRFQLLKKQVKIDQPYPLTEAVELLAKLNKGKKTNTVELHINTLENAIKGEISLPHSTGKKQVIEVFSDQTIVKINAGKIDFTTLLATPADMPKLAKYAKVLGPRGLMPNPKNGNLITDPKKRLAQLEKGSTLSYKTEPKFPIIHLTLGPSTQKTEHLTENITALIKHINLAKIKSVFLTSTQTPAIKLEI